MKEFLNLNLVDCISIFLGVVGAITGGFALMISRGGIVKEFFVIDNSDEMRNARREVCKYKKTTEQDLYDNLSFAKVCSHYHFCGLMVKHHYFPKCIFTSATAKTISKCYEQSRDYIELRRKDNEDYAYYFEELYKKINKCQ